MNGTADLRSEHIGVARMLGVMDAMADSAQAGTPPDVGDLTHAIKFLRVFVDQCHHTKEEELLFPAMRAAHMDTAETTIDILLADHAHGREAVARIATATQRIADGEESAGAELADALSEYTQLLRAHIRREEEDCFDVADRDLSSEVQSELNQGYQRVEREVVGKGVHEAFHSLLDRLSQTYPR